MLRIVGETGEVEVLGFTQCARHGWLGGVHLVNCILLPVYIQSGLRKGEREDLKVTNEWRKSDNEPSPSTTINLRRIQLRAGGKQ